jgi:hypothetical protein
MKSKLHCKLGLCNRIVTFTLMPKCVRLRECELHLDGLICISRADTAA